MTLGYTEGAAYYFEFLPVTRSHLLMALAVVSRLAHGPLSPVRKVTESLLRTSWRSGGALPLPRFVVEQAVAGPAPFAPVLCGRLHLAGAHLLELFQI